MASDQKTLGKNVAKVSRTINSPLEKAFRYIVPVDISHIFPRQGELPGVTGSSITTEWGTPGQQRLTSFDDGSTLLETLLTVEQNASFSYKCEEFTSAPLAALLQRIAGSWNFVDNGNETTDIEWQYELVPKSDETLSVVIEQLVPAYSKRMDDAMTILKSDLEDSRRGK